MVFKCPVEIRHNFQDELASQCFTTGILITKFSSVWHKTTTVGNIFRIEQTTKVNWFTKQTGKPLHNGRHCQVFSVD